MGSQLSRVFLGILVVGAIFAAGCQGGGNEQDAVAAPPVAADAVPAASNPNKPTATGNQPAGAPAQAAPMPPGANRDHP